MRVVDPNIINQKMEKLKTIIDTITGAWGIAIIPTWVINSQILLQRVESVAIIWMYFFGGLASLGAFIWSVIRIYDWHKKRNI